MNLQEVIADVPNFPKEGIIFKDITPLLANPKTLHYAVDRIVEHYSGRNVQKVLGIESRGFILGPAVAIGLDAGFVPVRKVGKLPRKTISQEYELEYGTDHVEIHEDAIQKGENVLILDDLIATGGTAKATEKLVEQLGGSLIGYAFLIELSFLGGTQLLNSQEILSLIKYDGE